MVGKPNFPEDVDGRVDLKGSSAGTPGLTALDQEREASLADEGGASGATVESQDLDTLHRIASELPVAHLPIAAPRPWPPSAGGKTLAVAIGALLIGAASAFAYRRWA